jgi:hypothetical protein
MIRDLLSLAKSRVITRAFETLCNAYKWVLNASVGRSSIKIAFDASIQLQHQVAATQKRVEIGYQDSEHQAT